MEAARDAIKDNVRPAYGGYRYWELAGVMTCGVCGCRMSKVRRIKGRGYEGFYHYYFCLTRVNKGQDACPQLKGFRAEQYEAKVWEFVRSLMLDPEHLLDDIERMIEEERNTMRGDPEREAAAWLDQLAAAERKRSAFQDMAAEGLITLDELRGKLADLDDLRLTAERELRLIEGRKDALRQLEQDRDALVEHYANMAPEALDALTPEERHQLYQILRLRVTADEDRNLTVEGVFGEFSVAEESSTWVMPISGTHMPDCDVLTPSHTRSALPGGHGPGRCGSVAQVVLCFGYCIEAHNLPTPSYLAGALQYSGGAIDHPPAAYRGQ